MVYAIVTIGVLQVIFDVIGLWLAWKLHGQSSRRIAIVERENVHLAGGVVKAQKAAEAADSKTEKYFESDHNAFTNIAEAGLEADAKIEQLNQRLLTLENKQQKIAPRPKRVNFREFRDAAERASEPEEAE